MHYVEEDLKINSDIFFGAAVKEATLTEAEPHHFYAAPAKIFDAAPAAPASTHIATFLYTIDWRCVPLHNSTDRSSI
jgi:hypothetical protein